jgi:hypothetical protein
MNGITPPTACHPEPFAVILSEAKNLALPLRVNSAKELALAFLLKGEVG